MLLHFATVPSTPYNTQHTVFTDFTRPPSNMSLNFCFHKLPGLIKLIQLNRKGWDWPPIKEIPPPFATTPPEHYSQCYSGTNNNQTNSLHAVVTSRYVTLSVKGLAHPNSRRASAARASGVTGIIHRPHALHSVSAKAPLPLECSSAPWALSVQEWCSPVQWV
jgi:hypothetical protein